MEPALVRHLVVHFLWHGKTLRGRLRRRRRELHLLGAHGGSAIVLASRGHKDVVEAGLRDPNNDLTGVCVVLLRPAEPEVASGRRGEAKDVLGQVPEPGGHLQHVGAPRAIELPPVHHGTAWVVSLNTPMPQLLAVLGWVRVINQEGLRGSDDAARCTDVASDIELVDGRDSINAYE